MGIADGKLAALRRKLAGLRQELAVWRRESERGERLEKHHTQIRRVARQLDAFAGEVEGRIEALAGDPSALLADGYSVERMVLDLNRIWEFFRSKLALRYVPAFTGPLAAADDFAWACYRPAQEAAREDHVPPEELKEPPLVFFNGGWSPFIVPRGWSYEAEAVPGEELATPAFRQALERLPIPVIGIPWYQLEHLPEAVVIGHEVGHSVEDDLRLTGRLEALLEAGLEARGVPAERRPAWRSWLGEIFADLYGVLATGPAFVGVLMELLATEAGRLRRETRRPDQWGDYPTRALRVHLNLEALARSGLGEESRELAARWRELCPDHALTAFEADLPPVVAALLEEPLPELSGTPLGKLLSFPRQAQEAARTDAQRLLQRFAPGSSDVRVLVAAARYAFEADPAAYREAQVQGEVLCRLTQVREVGIRRAAGRRPLAPEELDRRDARAGGELFELLAGV